MSDQPIHECVRRWHDYTNGRLDGGLDALLHLDCVFLSPVVFTPQRGRDVTKLYLSAAGGTLAGSTTNGPDDGLVVDPSGKFRYVKQICDGHHAMLEFETEVDGKYVNGVDILTCDDEG